MKISADFTVIPDDFAKAAAPEYFNGGVPVVSFPFYIDDVDDALMYDFNDSHALAIPPDFSRQLPAMIPETVQGRNSSASKFLGRSTDPAVIMRYNGPQPPDKDHEYYLQVWATKKPLPGLNQGFWLNELLHALRNSGEVPDTDGIFLTGKA